MELHARLVHAEAGLRVVEVRASRDGRPLGSALAEAATVQEAEDLAMARLLQRLNRQGAAIATLDANHDPTESRPAEASLGWTSAAAPADETIPANRTSALAVPAAAEASPRRGGDLPRPSRRPGPARPSTPSRQAAPLPSAPMEAAEATPRHPPDTAPPAIQAAETVAHDGPGEAAIAPPHAGSDGSGATHEEDPTRRPGQDPEPRPTGTAAEARDPAGPEPDDHGGVPPGDPLEEPPADPEDWSQELTAIDLELRRLGWSREEEGTYLQRAFGHPSRSRLTRYNDLRAYLMALEALERGSDPGMAAVPLRRSELLAQGDALLAQLGWSAEQGRAFLERELNRISRQQLNDMQLLQFNMLLEGEVLAAAARS